MMNRKKIAGFIAGCMLTGTLAIPVSAESVPGVYDLSAGEYPQGYAVSVEDAVEDIQHTLAEIQKQQNHIAGSDPLLEDLAIQLFALCDAVKQEDSVTEEVEELLQDVENLLTDVDSDIAETALSIVKSELQLENQVEAKEMIPTVPAEKPPTSPAVTITAFSDLPETHWAHQNVMEMVRQGLFSGTSTPVGGVGTFSPDDSMTKAQFLAVIIRYMYPEALEGMSAVPQGQPWYYNHYTLAIQNGLLKSGEFSLQDMNTAMTREEAALVLSRITSEQDVDINSLLPSTLISDYDEIGEAYRIPVLQVYSQRLIKGTSLDVHRSAAFEPKGIVSRAQGAAMINRLMEFRKEVVIDYDAMAITDSFVTHDRTRAARSTPMTFYWNDPTRPYLRDGDTFVAEDGTAYVMKWDRACDVVGVGVHVAADLGRTYGTEVVKDGGFVVFLPRGSQAGEEYLINPHTGEGHWTDEWARIGREYHPTYPGVKGELSQDKNFVWSDIAGGWVLVVANMMGSER